MIIYGRTFEEWLKSFDESSWDNSASSSDKDNHEMVAIETKRDEQEQQQRQPAQVDDANDNDDENGQCPQLEYILEYVTRDQKSVLPPNVVHNLLSLVCEEPSQPTTLPPHLLATACRTTFLRRLRRASLEDSIAGISYLDDLEGTRKRYVSMLKDTHSTEVQRFAKIDAETTELFTSTWTSLCRLTLLREINSSPFSPMHCLATVNILFSTKSRTDCMREHSAASVMLHKTNFHVQKYGARRLHDCPELQKYKRSVSDAKARGTLLQYLELANSLIAQIEDVIDPMPQELCDLGIKRSDPVMTRITKHLIATARASADEDGSRNGSNEWMLEESPATKSPDANIPMSARRRKRGRAVSISPEL